MPYFFADTNWKDAPIDDLISIEMKDDLPFYVNESYVFHCRMLSFVLAESYARESWWYRIAENDERFMFNLKYCK